MQRRKVQTFVHILASRTTASSKVKRNMVCKYTKQINKRNYEYEQIEL